MSHLEVTDDVITQITWLLKKTMTPSIQVLGFHDLGLENLIYWRLMVGTTVITLLLDRET